LMATSINEEQASYMSAIQNAVQKLSNVNQSLLLLTRLENREYSPDQEVNISEKLNNALVAFHELIQMRGLDYESNIEPEVVIRAHPTLVEIMLSNLISNAIRHNIKDGRIGVELNSGQLRIENTGEDPMVPTGELFKRFKKNNQSSESTGLGLSIVSQICEVNNFTIDYSFGNGIHSIVVKFQ
jgi:two-component system sensor histidine kinase QseC